MSKKYGGVIHDWYTVDCSDLEPELSKMYGPTLGYIIRGHLKEDPTGRGFAGYPLRTSLVVKFSDEQIETLNTVYDLGEPNGNG